MHMNSLCMMWSVEISRPSINFDYVAEIQKKYCIILYYLKGKKLHNYLKS